MARRVLLLALLGSLSVVAGAGSAAAECDDTPLTLEDAVAGAPIVFTGRVSSVDQGRTDAAVAVAAVWKGPDLPATVRVLGGFPGDVDALSFTVGSSYLFFPSNGSSPFQADSCSGTRRYSGAVLAIPPYLADDAGATVGRPPLTTGSAEPPSSGSALPALFVMATVLGVAGIAALGLAALRRPVRTTGSHTAEEPAPALKTDRRDSGKVRARSHRTGPRSGRRSAR